jgi:septal ring factor EnvC (AmiA/AmiB activator)
MKQCILLLAAIFVVHTFASAQSNRNDLEKQRAAIQKEIDEVRKSLNETQKNKKISLGELSLVQRKLRLRMQEIDNINKQMRQLDDKIYLSYRDINKLKKELDTLKMQYEKSVLYAYKNRSNYDFLNFIFSASNFNDALKRVAYLKSYRNYREQQVATIHNTQIQLEQKIAVLNNNKQQKSTVLAEQTKQRMVLEVEKKEKDAVVSKLKLREKELNREIAAKKKQDQKLASAINTAIRRAREEAAREAAAAAKKKQAEEAVTAAKTKTTTPGATTTAPVAKTEPRVTKPESVFDADPASKALSDDFEKNRGSLPWPIESGRVSMHFGRQRVEDLKIDYDNPGITIETDAGKSVRAVFDGEVATVFFVGDVQAIVLKHGKYFTTYSNLVSATVSKGQQVKRGQVIGRVAEKSDGSGDIEFLISNEKSQNFDPEKWLR